MAAKRGGGDKTSSNQDNTSSDRSNKKKGGRKQYGTHAAKKVANKPSPLTAEKWSEEIKERSKRRNTIYM